MRTAFMTLTGGSVQKSDLIDLLEREGRKFVRLPNGFEYEERDVEVGIRGDAGRLQIISGISQGEEIILTIREAE